MAKRRNRLIHQAALQSLVRFGPQVDALAELQRAAEESYGAAVGGANVAAAGTKATIKAERPKLSAVYDEAGLRQAALAASLGPLMSQGLKGLEASPTTDLLRGLGANEATAAATHLNEAKVQAMQDLTNRGLQAEAGRTQTIAAAGAKLHDDLAQIGRTRLSLTGQAGAFQAATLGDLQEAQTDRAFKARQNRLDRQARAQLNAEDNATSLANTQARLDAQNAKGKKGTLPNGVKRATPLQHGAARDTVEQALEAAKFLRDAEGRDRHEIGQLLISGRGKSTIEDDDGTKLPVRGIPAVKQLLASVALDILYDGHVSARNRKLLNARGLTVKGLGYKGPPSGQARQRELERKRRRRRPKSVAETVGQALAGG